MPISAINPPVKYIATITGVREVMLRGTADLGFWQRQLAGTGLSPLTQEGQAQVVISAIAASFQGLPFRELCVSMLVDDVLAPGREAYYLVHAFNSSRMFALIERTCFSTPYFPADLHVATEPSPVVELAGASGPLFRAALPSPAPTAATRYQCWEGRLYLPPASSKPGGPGKWFAARLEGETQVLDFTPADTLTIAPGAPPILQSLRESGFRGQQWSVRSAATHARSKTFSRPR